MIQINKKILTTFLAILAVVLLLVLIILTSRFSKSPEQITTIPVIPTETVTGVYNEPAATDLTQVAKEIPSSIAQKEKTRLATFLPITINDVLTSAGITTKANIFSISSDPSQMIHIEIYGINYNLSDATLDNPQAVAFVDTFNLVKKNLSEKGININNLQIIYGTRNYIQTTAQYWVKYFKLLP